MRDRFPKESCRSEILHTEMERRIPKIGVKVEDEYSGRQGMREDGVTAEVLGHALNQCGQ